jgi:hypothetical protein
MTASESKAVTSDVTNHSNATPAQFQGYLQCCLTYLQLLDLWTADMMQPIHNTNTFSSLFISMPWVRTERHVLHSVPITFTLKVYAHAPPPPPPTHYPLVFATTISLFRMATTYVHFTTGGAPTRFLLEMSGWMPLILQCLSHLCIQWHTRTLTPANLRILSLARVPLQYIIHDIMHFEPYS